MDEGEKLVVILVLSIILGFINAIGFALMISDSDNVFKLIREIKEEGKVSGAAITLTILLLPSVILFLLMHLQIPIRRKTKIEKIEEMYYKLKNK